MYVAKDVLRMCVCVCACAPVPVSLDSALCPAHVESGATKTAAVVSFTDGTECSIIAVATVQSD
jgi:hypothetical protein